MKIFVTGANGFIGQHLVRRLIDARHEVNSQRVDITSPFIVEGSFDIVVHLAAYNITNIGNIDPTLYSQINVIGTENVINRISAKRFIFLSTTKVYDKNSIDITEENNTEPQQAYEISKLKAEEICLSHKDKKSMVILRATNTYGPGQSQKAVIPVFFKKAITGEPIKISAPRGLWLQLIYVYDLVKAIESVINSPQVQGVFNVASDELVQIQDLAQMIKKTSHSSSDIQFLDNRSDVKSKISSEKIKKITGWKPTVKLDDGLNRCYEFIKDQRN